MNIMKLVDDSYIQFITFATSRDDGHQVAVYQELVPPFAFYTMEKEKFMELMSVDEADLDFQSLPAMDVQNSKPKDEKDRKVSIMEQFLDADTYREKIRILEIHRERIASNQLELMAAALDEYIEGVDQDELFYSFMQVLKTRARFESDRK